MTGQTKTFYLRQLLEDRIYELKDRYIAKQRLENPTERLTSQQMRRPLAWKIEYDRHVLSRIKKLDRTARQQILDYFDARIERFLDPCNLSTPITFSGARDRDNKREIRSMTGSLFYC